MPSLPPKWQCRTLEEQSLLHKPPQWKGILIPYSQFTHITLQKHWEKLHVHSVLLQLDTTLPSQHDTESHQSSVSTFSQYYYYDVVNMETLTLVSAATIFLRSGAPDQARYQCIFGIRSGSGTAGSKYSGSRSGRIHSHIWPDPICMSAFTTSWHYTMSSQPPTLSGTEHKHQPRSSSDHWLMAGKVTVGVVYPSMGTVAYDGDERTTWLHSLYGVAHFTCFCEHYKVTVAQLTVNVLWTRLHYDIFMTLSYGSVYALSKYVLWHFVKTPIVNKWGCRLSFSVL